MFDFFTKRERSVSVDMTITPYTHARLEALPSETSAQPVGRRTMDVMTESRHRSLNAPSVAREGLPVTVLGRVSQVEEVHPSVATRLAYVAGETQHDGPVEPAPSAVDQIEETKENTLQVVVYGRPSLAMRFVDRVGLRFVGEWMSLVASTFHMVTGEDTLKSRSGSPEDPNILIEYLMTGTIFNSYYEDVRDICASTSVSNAHAKKAVNRLFKYLKFGEIGVQARALRLWALMLKHSGAQFDNRTSKPRFISQVKAICTTTYENLRACAHEVVAGVAYAFPHVRAFRNLWNDVKYAGEPIKGIPIRRNHLLMLLPTEMTLHPRARASEPTSTISMQEVARNSLIVTGSEQPLSGSQIVSPDDLSEIIRDLERRDDDSRTVSLHEEIAAEEPGSESASDSGSPAGIEVAAVVHGGDATRPFCSMARLADSLPPYMEEGGDGGRESPRSYPSSRPPSYCTTDR